VYFVVGRVTNYNYFVDQIDNLTNILVNFTQKLVFIPVTRRVKEWIRRKVCNVEKSVSDPIKNIYSSSGSLAESI